MRVHLVFIHLSPTTNIKGEGQENHTKIQNRPPNVPNIVSQRAYLQCTQKF